MYKYFKKLIGEDQEYKTNTIQIKTISESTFDIKPRFFTNEEYGKIKEDLKYGKDSWLDGIAPKILKYVNYDDILFEISNKILT